MVKARVIGSSVRLAYRLWLRLFVGLFLGLSMVAACAEGETAAPSGEGETEGLGTMQFALKQAPADALCLRLTFANAMTMQKAVRNLALTAGNATNFTVTGLPLGPVTITGEAFNVACANVTATTPWTWLSDPLTVTLTTDLTSSVTLTLVKAGRANVGVDFVSNLPIEEVDLPAPALKVASAPDGSVVFSLPSINQVWRASNVFNAKLLANLPGQPRYVTVANDGVVFVNIPGANVVASFTAAGAPKDTIQLAWVAGDMLVDTAKTLWVGSSAAAQVMRVATATTTPVAMQLQIPTGGPTPGLALAGDQTLRVGSASGSVFTLSPAGIVQGSFVAPFPVRDVSVGPDGAVWMVSNNSPAVAKLPPGSMAPMVVFNGSQTGGEAIVVSTPKGTLVPLGGGGLLYVPVTTNVPTVVNLPQNAQVLGLAAGGDGRIWASDFNRSRLLVITLP